MKPCICDQQVGSAAKDENRRLLRLGEIERIDDIALGCGFDEVPSRPADAKRGQRRERNVFLNTHRKCQFSAQSSYRMRAWRKTGSSPTWKASASGTSPTRAGRRVAR